MFRTHSIHPSRRRRSSRRRSLLLGWNPSPPPYIKLTSPESEQLPTLLIKFQISQTSCSPLLILVFISLGRLYSFILSISLWYVCVSNGTVSYIIDKRLLYHHPSSSKRQSRDVATYCTNNPFKFVS